MSVAVTRRPLICCALTLRDICGREAVVLVNPTGSRRREECDARRGCAGVTTLVDRTVAALRASHDTLAALVSTLSEEQLTGRSGATEWTVAQVLSHLGSGAEIARKPIETACGQQVEGEENQSIWARCNASAPAEQADLYFNSDPGSLA